MTRLPAAPTYFHKPVTALNAHGGAVVRPRGLPVAQLRGRDRHRDRPHLPQRLARTRRATTSPATRSATTTGCTTSATPTPARCCGSRAPTRSRRSARAWSPTGTSAARRCAPSSTARSSQEASTDEMEWDMHYLVADIARTITLSPGDLLFSGTPANSRPVAAGRRRRGRGRGPRRADQPRRRPARRRSAPTSAPSRPRARRSSRPRSAATGSSAAIRTPSQGPVPLDGRGEVAGSGRRRFAVMRSA